MQSAVSCSENLMEDGMLRRAFLCYLLCDVIPQCLGTGLHAQIVPVSIQTHQTTCPQATVGENSFPGFYIMAQFQIAELARRGTVKRVPGATSQHPAYRIGPEFNFRINTRSAYATGLPEQFTFEAVFRMDGNTLSKNWNIWQMQDLNGNEQLAVRLNGPALSLEFSYITVENRPMTALFPYLPLLFNSRWHKMLLVVRKSSVSLVLDCIPVDSQQLPARGTVNLDGFTHIGKLKDNPAVPVPVRC